jgi:hypothetical protein
VTSLCFQQFGKSAFRLKLTPMARKTSHSGALWHRGRACFCSIERIPC